VLHDAHLHHARAACLLRTLRAADYRAEFAASHPDAHPDLAELAVRGFDSHLHYFSPMTTLIARASRAVAVHTEALACRLRADVPEARVEVFRLGHGSLLSDEESTALGSRTRRRYGIGHDALVFGCYGGLTADKRLTQVLSAFAATRAYAPSAHLLLVGAVPAHDKRCLHETVARLGLDDCCTVTGYLESDDEFTACVAAADVTLNLRWPTAREVSGPWLQALAAGKPTITIDLAHMVDVPSVDPRTWQASSGAAPCTIAIDILDEDHSLRLAMRRLATDPSFRAELGQAGRQHWLANHTLDHALEDYRRVIAQAAELPTPGAALPQHLTADGTRTLQQVMAQFGLPSPLGD
jgi:glycosyltransferase involved in cell wall biosynthesis